MTVKPDPDQCPKCFSANLLRVTGQDEPTVHYGRLSCGDCGRFVKWLKNPSVCLENMNRKGVIDELLKFRLGDWDKQFLSSVRDVRVLTERQKIQLNRISREKLNRDIVAIVPKVEYRNQKVGIF